MKKKSPVKKKWIKLTAKVKGVTYHLYDFHTDRQIAEKIKREALFEGAKAVKIILRKNTYFEAYPSGEPIIESVYGVYVRG